MRIKRLSLRSVLVVLVIIIGVLSVLDYLGKKFDKMNGRYADSNTKEESRNNGFYVIDYKPEKDTLVLLNGEKVILGQAWAEAFFYYSQGERQQSESTGYHLHVPFQGNNEDFVFTMSLLDINNQAFTNGIENSQCVLCPQHLTDSIDIVIEEKNPIDSIGWKNALVTDTVTLFKLRNNN